MSHTDKLAALAKLMVGRQATVSDDDLHVYLEDLADIEPAIVAAACETLRKRPKREYETAFPCIGDILEACRLAKIEQRHEAQRQLAAKCTTPEDPPASPPLTRAEAKAFVARLKADVERLRKAKR